MATRRGFLGALAAATLFPRPSWADAGAPSFLAAARLPDGSFALCGLDGTGNEVFAIPLPDRGHAAAAHPERPEAVAFARRPGTFALVIDCVSGHVTARLEAPEGRHFYGHGAFSPDGDMLFTTENDFETGTGRIGLWDRAVGYARIGEFASGGIGPHDMKLTGDGLLVIANGGIKTHPDSGREKLNLATMRPNLAYLTPEGTMVEVVELAAGLRLNSIRHLALGPDGLVAFAMQWQGETGDSPTLIGTHRRGEAPRLGTETLPDRLRSQGYAGSVAVSPDGALVAYTAPRGGACFVYETASLALAKRIDRADVCGIAASTQGLLLTDGAGGVSELGAEFVPLRRHGARQWDNHLVAL